MGQGWRARENGRQADNPLATDFNLMRFRPHRGLETYLIFYLGLTPQALCFHTLRGFPPSVSGHSNPGVYGR